MFDLNAIKVEPGQILVMKVDTNRYDSEEAYDLFKSVRENTPKGIPILCLPTGVELDVECIKDVIEDLKEILK